MAKVLNTETIKGRKGTILSKVLKQDGICAEIGVLRGSFSRAILDINRPETLYLIDCWEHQSKGYEGDPANSNQQRQKDNHLFVVKTFGKDRRVRILKQFSLKAASFFKKEYFDWVYIDANHSYKAVTADLTAWWPLIKPGGYIWGDDYIKLDSMHFGVIEAVHAFADLQDLDIEFVTEVTHGDWGIKKPDHYKQL